MMHDDFIVAMRIDYLFNCRLTLTSTLHILSLSLELPGWAQFLLQQEYPILDQGQT